MPDSASEIDPLTQIRVEAGSPTAEQAAAAIAVVAGMLREGGVVEEAKTTDAWRDSIRTPRTPIAGRDWIHSLRP
jgi:hypothetical protein